MSGPTVADPISDERSGRQRPSLDGLGLRDETPGPDTGLGVGFAAGLAGAGLTAPAANDAPLGAGPHGRGTEPTFVLPPEPAAPEPDLAEPLLPDLLPPPAEPVAVAPPPPEPTVSASPEADTVMPDDHAKPRVFDVEEAGEPLRLYPTLDTTDLTPLPAPEPPPAPEPVTLADKPDVVGTYKSGGNTYVMYANGSIEAETPRGRFTFGSLDELKDFVRAGGESDTRGAA
jgi:hypothetical protein